MTDSRRFRLPLVSLAVVALLAACTGGGGGGGGSTIPVATPTPTPTPTGVVANAFACPTSDTTFSAGRSPASAYGAEAARFVPARAGAEAPAASGTTLLAVTYDRATALSGKTALEARERALGLSASGDFDFPAIGTYTRVVPVASAQAGSMAAALRAQSGVRSVAVTGQRRYATRVTTPYLPNDPYFVGFAGTAAPYRETSTIPGEWDMHAVGLEYAWGYSQPGNGSGIVNANALGSSSVKLAVIDTGEDSNHPDLTGKIAFKKCFITNTSGSQSTSNFATDPTGHGTDVAGIAAAAINNGFGFVGTGGNVVIYAYRVFPTPNDSCTSPTSTDPRCGSTTIDIASAINDAVARGVNVINLSLGGGACTSGGQDPDTLEGQAIANAIASRVVVVAASGNETASHVDAPGCDPGVIAAGASGLADGTQNGTNSKGTPAAPVEYVASYSNYGSATAQYRNTAAWGIVAPGGDPSGSSDTDDLHWIEHIWTTTPFDTNFAGGCTVDRAGASNDCRVLIAGTSMASPHVAGIAALIISANAAYQSPSGMKTLLCSTTDDIADPHEGCGRVNVYRAMAVALGDPTPP